MEQGLCLIFSLEININQKVQPLQFTIHKLDNVHRKKKKFENLCKVTSDFHIQIRRKKMPVPLSEFKNSKPSFFRFSISIQRK